MELPLLNFYLKSHKKVFGNHHPKNIKFEENLRSNIDQYKNTKRLVTFSGNSHLEAACFGIKPIIISNTTLCDFGKKFYFKPKRIDHYQNLLLNGEEKKFRRHNGGPIGD